MDTMILIYLFKHKYNNMRVKEFIEQNIDLIDADKWQIIYDRLKHSKELQPHQIGKFSRMMLECEINPLEHMNYIPSYFGWCINWGSAYAKTSCSFENLYIPDNITKLNTKCFANSNWLKELSLPCWCTLDSKIFEDTESLQKIEIRLSNPLQIGTHTQTYNQIQGEIPRNCEIIFKSCCIDNIEDYLI